MADAPDTLLLAQLRELRATLAGYSVRFDRIDEHFSHLDKRFEDLEARHDLAESWQRRVDERFDEIERRLTQVEPKNDT
jgi:N-dimethylarginine dimethylaminohydrolase